LFGARLDWPRQSSASRLLHTGRLLERMIRGACRYTCSRLTGSGLHLASKMVVTRSANFTEGHGHAWTLRESGGLALTARNTMESNVSRSPAMICRRACIGTSRANGVRPASRPLKRSGRFRQRRAGTSTSTRTPTCARDRRLGAFGRQDSDPSEAEMQMPRKSGAFGSFWAAVRMTRIDTAGRRSANRKPTELSGALTMRRLVAATPFVCRNGATDPPGAALTRGRTECSHTRQEESSRKRRVCHLPAPLASSTENDGLNWPHCDGLNWPHLRPIVA